MGCVEARLYTMAGDLTGDVYGGEDAVPTTVGNTSVNWNGSTMYGVGSASQRRPLPPLFLAIGY